MLKVANIVFNSFTNDSRVLKESISFSNKSVCLSGIDKGRHYICSLN
jgi:hypothetical protein